MTDEKKKKKTSPTERTLKRLRDDGVQLVAIVEKWNRFGGALRPDGTPTGIRIDLFGFIDVLAVVTDQVGTTGIQACTAGDLSKRIRKVIDDPILLRRAELYTRAGNRLLFWGWKQDKRTKRWIVIERDFKREPRSMPTSSQATFFGDPTPEDSKP